jgi:hypothetical protein
MDMREASASFCEQKEAKKLCAVGFGIGVANARHKQKFFAVAREGLLFLKKNRFLTYSASGRSPNSAFPAQARRAG